MKRSNGQSLPKARKNDLVTRQIPGELLVYDLKRHKAFCLNDTAASIWKNCNGKRTISDLARGTGTGGKNGFDEKVVWLAVDQLEKSNLLEQKVFRPANLPPVSRRGLIRMGIAGAIALPIVTMIASPTASAAGTPITNAICTTPGRPTAPGGCGGNPCTDVAGKTCIPKNPAQCQCG